MSISQAAKKIIVALDVSSTAQARDLVVGLRDRVGMFKIGLQLFTASGPSVVREVKEAGGRVFLDLKLHDIPNTVAASTIEAGRLGIEMLTLHVSGGSKMLKETRERIDEAADREGWRPPLLLGVTVLTSIDSGQLATIGLRNSIQERVVGLAELAKEVGMDGVVASPQELPLLNRAGLEGLIRVTPGIRPLGSVYHDQARVATPVHALRQGADYLVIGRPITQAPNPGEAANAIVRALERDRIEPG